MVDTQVAEDIALGHRDMEPQDLQDIVDRHGLVLIQLYTGGQRGWGWVGVQCVGPTRSKISAWFSKVSKEVS